MQFNRTRIALLGLLLASLAACGGSSDPKEATAAGAKALGSNDYATAAREYGAALATIGTDTAHPQFGQAKVGLMKSMAGIDPAKCKDQVLALMSSHPDLVTDKVIYDVADRLGQNKHFSEAIALVEAGKAKFPDSKALQGLVTALGDKLKAGGSNPEELERLKGLGYLGD